MSSGILLAINSDPKLNVDRVAIVTPLGLATISHNHCKIVGTGYILFYVNSNSVKCEGKGESGIFIFEENTLFFVS